MKTIEATHAAAAHWLDLHLIEQVAAGTHRGLTITLNPPKGGSLQEQWAQARQWALTWRRQDEALPPGVALEWGTRMLSGSAQQLPMRLHLADLDATVYWAGDDYSARLHQASERWSALMKWFPDTATENTLRTTQMWMDVDFELLISTARWFSGHPVADHTWTPRQVPVPGLHAKWLDNSGRRSLIASLINVPSVHLRTRPQQARITYLDPAHAVVGGRRWDIVTGGDVVKLPYVPQTLLITENRDTAFYFPPEVPGGIAALGNGDAVVNLITSLSPIMTTARTIYWGDIDADGLRIVSRLRSRGHRVTTILMDLPSYMIYEHYGTNIDRRGQTIPPGDPTLPPNLTSPETALFVQLTDPTWNGHRRVEQERIPLTAALAALEAVNEEMDI